MDSDSLDPDAIEERQQSTEELIRAADSSIPVKVVSAVPAIEAWFFAAPQAIERVFGKKVPAELVRLGRRDPKAVLQQIEERSKRKWNSKQAIDSLDVNDIERIRALPEVAELRTFLKKVHDQCQAGSPGPYSGLTSH
jgi:hypothetical protein